MMTALHQLRIASYTDRILGEGNVDPTRLDAFAEAAEKNARTKERLKAERAKDNEITMKAYNIK